MDNKTKKLLADIKDRRGKIHGTWHKFSDYVVKIYGKDLHGKWQYVEVTAKNGKKKKMRYRSFNELELSRRLVGYEAMERIRKWARRYAPQIRFVRCDDSVYSGSDILLIPHPKHGITVIFIPQCTSVQNQFFLYKSHFEMLIKELNKMKRVYPKNDYA